MNKCAFLMADFSGSRSHNNHEKTGVVRHLLRVFRYYTHTINMNTQPAIFCILTISLAAMEHLKIRKIVIAFVLVCFQLGVLLKSSSDIEEIQSLNKEKLVQGQKLSQITDYGDVDPSPVPTRANSGPTPHAERGLKESSASINCDLTWCTGYKKN